jgi:tetratricopeptide (TPR) repeat protein
VDESDRLKREGIEARRFGFFADAIAFFTQSLDANSANMDSLYDRALAYMKMNNFEAALADADVVLRADPRDFRVSLQPWIPDVL